MGGAVVNRVSCTIKLNKKDHCGQKESRRMGRGANENLSAQSLVSPFGSLNVTLARSEG